MKYTLHHPAISVRNLEASLKFYETFGYRQVHYWEAEDKSLIIVHLKLGESFLEIFAYTHNQSMPLVDYEYANNLGEIGAKHIALRADDIVATLEELKQKGLADDTTEIKQGRTNVTYFFIKDPDGIWVEFIEDRRGY